MDFKFVPRTDASDRGLTLSAALMPRSQGKLFPVAYASKRLSDRERKYSVIEREPLAIRNEKIAFYLYDTDFTLQTDLRLLQNLNAAKVMG
ncbi:Ty3/gypsy family of RNAse hi in long-term repeat domain-containing protein [Plakobranchus ocellatus]|uniref:Ty3/gypsy family of RNAse hi in long-term repeat domain-containing protein n=1 Tax=Plakobranchus ocellatus TaxID=259542 RepID=A0AAV4B8U5_9GAST|nr:Ty3/gypsy family of RNAse hi in long-term repeat domain-containing protein [Plakobranchus ocellatus]